MRISEWSSDVCSSDLAGGGAHVCNAGYMTSAAATGRGVARAMGLHSIDHAKARGFRAMQFNFVVSTNVRAVGLWQSLGIEAAAPEQRRAFEIGAAACFSPFVFRPPAFGDCNGIRRASGRENVCRDGE